MLQFQTMAITVLDAHRDALEELARDCGAMDRGKPNISAMFRALVQAEVARRAKAEGKAGGKWSDILDDIRSQRVLSRAESISQAKRG